MSRFAKLTTATKVGVFAVITLVAAFAIYRFVSKGAGSGSGYRVYALMNDAMGIAKHSYVRMAGIPTRSPLVGGFTRCLITLVSRTTACSGATPTGVGRSGSR